MTDNPVSRTAHNPPRVVSFGEILFDVIGGVPYLGGAPLNLAAHLRKQGAETTLISAVGNDPLGRDALGQIGKLGLDTGTIAVLDGFPTGTVTVLLDERKVAAYDFAMDTAYDHIPVPGFDTEVDLFCFGTLAQRSPESRGTLTRLRKMLDCLFFYDVNLRQDFYSKEIIEESLYSADIVKLNEDEFPVLAAMFGLPDDPEELRRRFGLQMVLLTLGPEGCDLYSSGGVIHSPAVPVKVVSTVGAGDSFSAAFLYHYLTGSTLNEALTAGNLLAAKIAGQKGAI
ncbi:MAG: carbohydrate kinase [Victivallales bacterium]